MTDQTNDPIQAAGDGLSDEPIPDAGDAGDAGARERRRRRRGRRAPRSGSASSRR